MKSKYGNHKTMVGGFLFDSKREAARYQELKLLQAAGKIACLMLHPKFELVPKTKKRRAVTYSADFQYKEPYWSSADGMGPRQAYRDVVEDVKSTVTAKNKAYIVKRNLFEYQNPNITFREVIA